MLASNIKKNLEKDVKENIIKKTNTKRENKIVHKYSGSEDIFCGLESCSYNFQLCD